MTINSNVAQQSDGIAEILHSCPLCSGTHLQRLPTPGHWIGRDIFSAGQAKFGLSRCQSCSLAFVNPRPATALLDGFYGCETYACHSPKAGSNRTATFLLECVARYRPYEGTRLLDFGCGGGFLLRAALNCGWNALGYDVGQRAIASCRALGLEVTNDLSECNARSFDVVFLNHVFEHIAEPQGVLTEFRRLLKKNGKLFLVVPNLAGIRARLAFPPLSRLLPVDERHRAFPIHLFYFTPQTLSRTLEKHGFRVIATETFGMGLDEFITRPGVAAEKAGRREHESSDAPVEAKKKSGFREIVKKGLFRADLGENLLAVAQPL